MDVNSLLCCYGSDHVKLYKNFEVTFSLLLHEELQNI